MKYVFVGERPSETAVIRRWNWQNGRLAAKQLFDALKAIGIDPQEQQYLNLWPHKRLALEALRPVATSRVWKIVGMGAIVQAELEKARLPHLKLVHPAARGTIRGKKRYAEHCKAVLL